MAVSAVVELQKASRRYGAKWAVAGVDLRVMPGCRMGITGPSGSGKSTVARLLTLGEDPEEGRRLIQGVEATQLTEDQRRRQRRPLQLVFQNPEETFVHHWKVQSILAEVCETDEAASATEPEEALLLAGLDSSLLQQKAGQLSGGQRKRLALARALMVKPQMLVLDETLAGQDEPQRARLRDQLAPLALALVVISHELRVLRSLCRELVVMEDGAIVESGPMEAVLGRPRHALTRELIAASL